MSSLFDQQMIWKSQKACVAKPGAINELRTLTREGDERMSKLASADFYSGHDVVFKDTGAPVPLARSHRRPVSLARGGSSLLCTER